jgi:Divergent InlB B-repeat domain
MSSLGILTLPETNTVLGNDLFIVQQNDVTSQVSLNNLLFGYDNATFAPTISAHTTQIAFLSTTLYSLSSQAYNENAYLNNLIQTQVNNAFTNLSLALYPISSVKCTSDNVNPGFYIPNTKWVLVSQGQFLAGTGHTYENGAPYTNGDKNRNNVFIYPGANAAAAGSPPGDLYYTSLVNSPIHGGAVIYTPGWEPYNYGGFTQNQPVLLKAISYPGYVFAGLVITNADGTYFNNNQGNLDPSVFDTTTTPCQSSFYMPGNNLTVTCNWYLSSSSNPNDHYVTLQSNPVGAGSCQYQTGYAPTHDGGFFYNEPVVIVGQAYAGYVLLGFTVNGSGFSQPVDYSKPGEVSFYMPASDVTVTANYGIAPANSLGEYNVGLDTTQIPPHSHDFQIQLQCTNSTTGYQNGPQAAPAYRLDTLTTYTTLSNITTDTPHNNVPPLYGTYVWMRVA